MTARVRPIRPRVANAPDDDPDAEELLAAQMSDADAECSSQGGTLSEIGSEGRPDKSAAAWEGAAYAAPSTFFTTRPPPREFILRDSRRETNNGVLVAGKVAALVAEGGVGKTQAASDLTVAVATGTNWLGCINAAKPGRVLLVLGEEDREEAQRRAYTSCLSTRPPADNAVVVLALAGMPCAMLEHDARGNTTEAAFLLWLRDWLSRNGPFGIVILDPLTRFAGPEAERDNAEGTRFVQAVESLVIPSGGAAIMVAHHTAKASRNGAAVSTAGSRGSSSLTDGFRWVATMASQALAFDDPVVQERLGEVVTVAFTKSNYTRKSAPILLRRGERGELVPLDPVDLALVEEVRSGSVTRRAKVSARDAERTARAQREADERTARQAQREAATRKRDAEDDATVQRILTETPTITVRNLRLAVRAERSCGGDRAESAIRRVRKGAST